MTRPATLLAMVTAAVLTTLALLASPRPSVADPTLSPAEFEFVDLLNEYRAQNGSGPLQPDLILTTAADWHSNDMASKNYFSHTDSLNRSPGQRAGAFGYQYLMSENIGAGLLLVEPQELLNAFISSPGHNANMLRPEWNAIGIGAAYNPSSTWGLYWTVDFGSVVMVPAGGEPPPTPIPTPTPSPTPTPTPSPTPTPTPSPTPSPTPTPAGVRGDADCDSTVGSLDALAVLQSKAGAAAPDCLSNADVDCDGDLDALDALAILKWVVSDPLPISSGCSPIGLSA